MKKVLICLLSLVLILGFILTGCSSSPTTASAPTQAPPGTTTSAAPPSSMPATISSTSAQPTAASPLDQIIAGAKAEGTVSVGFLTTFNPTNVQQLAAAIKAKYGVDLKITFTPLLAMPPVIAKIVMERKTGAPPDFDLMSLAEDQVIPDMLQSGSLQKIDWESLASQASVPTAAIMGVANKLDTMHDYGLLFHNSHWGLMYNPSVVSASAVPKKLTDLANPQWKGKLGMRAISSVFTEQSYFLGATYIENALTAIVKSGVILDTHANLANRLSLGELSMSYTVSEFLPTVKKAIPNVQWQSIDLSMEEGYYNCVLTGAAHPNAAKLVALFLASSDGYQFLQQNLNVGNTLYANASDYEYGIDQADRASGLISYTTFNQAILDFQLSSNFQTESTKINTILTGG